jgi:transcriptional regulator with XRE-family HTH domain
MREGAPSCCFSSLTATSLLGWESRPADQIRSAWVLDCHADYAYGWRMSTTTHRARVQDAWQTPRNARTLRAFMALQNQDIAERLKDLRRARGNPPQTTVASRIGIGERTYQTWEQGEAKPSYRNLERLAEYYGVTEDFILTGHENSRPEPVMVVSERVEDVREEFQSHVQAMRDDVSRVHADLQRVLRNQTAIMRELGIRASGEGAEPVVAYPESDRRRGERRHGS